MQALPKNRKGQIYAIASELFSNRGYHATSMRDLAAQLGMQGGSLYAHISSKEELLAEIVTQATEWFEQALRPLMQTTHSPEEKLFEALKAHIEVIATHLDAAKVFFHEWQHLGPEFYEKVALRRDAVEKVYRNLIQEGINQGAFRKDLDVKMATFLILSAANWTYIWYRSNGCLNAEEIARVYADMLLPGLKASR
ncbi:MAG: TetR/AcrR family transcriptional regulator [Deinococcaceae bacterium]